MVSDDLFFDDENEPTRCPQCGCIAEGNLFFADDDVDMEHPLCECGYEWQVAEDVRIVDLDDAMIEDGDYPGAWVDTDNA